MKQPSSHLLDAKLKREAETTSKAMLGVGQEGRPFLDYLLANIALAGYDDVVIVVNERDTAIREFYATGRSSATEGVRISFAVQRIPPGRSKPLGTADALVEALRAKPAWKGTHFTVCNADNLYSVRALSMLREWSAENALIDYDASALAFDEGRIARFAVLGKNGAGRLTSIIEKPTPLAMAQARDSGGRLGVSMNIFRFSYDEILPVLEDLPLHPERQEKEIPEAVRVLISRKPGAVATLPLAEHVPDLTSQDDIVRVQQELREL